MNQPIPKPNYTQIPNVLLGDMVKGGDVPGLMASMTEAELKVVLALSRLTLGFHRSSARASLTRLQRLTGMSRQGVLNGIKAARERGLVDSFDDGGVIEYVLLVNEIDQQETQLVNEVDQLVNEVDQTSQRSRPPSKKETKKETSRKKEFAHADACEREASSATTQPSEKKERAQDIPAAVTYHEITHRWPPRATWDSLRPIHNGGLALWEKVVREYIAHGWNPANLSGMLEFYNRREIPGRPGAAVMAPADPEAYVNVDDFFGFGGGN